MTTTRERVKSVIQVNPDQVPEIRVVVGGHDRLMELTNLVTAQSLGKPRRHGPSAPRDIGLPGGTPVHPACPLSRRIVTDLVGRSISSPRAAAVGVSDSKCRSET